MHHVFSVDRQFAAERANRIANDPEVRPWLGGSGPLDFSALVANLANVLLMNEEGGVFFENLEPGLYEAHTLFLPEGRGEKAVHAVRDALRWMFTKTDAVEIVTKVPEGNKGALGLVRAIHGEKRFHRDNAILIDRKPAGVDYYALPIMSWAGKAEGIAASGQWFHEKLEAAKSATEGAAPLHDDDEAHDRYVGATVEMIGSGQLAKGINFYNRWAKVSGYGPVSVIALNPIVIDIGDAILAVRGDDFDVLLCR